MDEKQWDNVAKDYFNELSSPFEHDAISPLDSEIEKIKDKTKIVLDVGCGVGNLIPKLALSFGKVVAFDFSQGMVDEAKKRSLNQGLKNVEILKKDMTDLEEFKEKFDFAFSINSVIMPSTRDADKSINEIFNAIKKGGKLIAVFPALESVLYESMVVHERQLEKFDCEKHAAMITKRRVGKQYYDFFTGMIDVDGDKQKHYYQFEIEFRLKKAGFKNIKVKKVLYPWDKFQNTTLPESVKTAHLWDWFVTADK